MSFTLSLLTQILAAAVILASLRVLVGMGGVISFGHALYVGMGAYAAAHVLRLAQVHDVTAPLVLVPLAGGVAGLLVAIPAGWLSTRRPHAIYMAMVTLALCELVYALAQMWPAVFGDEGGIQFDRTAGNFWLFNFADERWVVLVALFYAASSLVFFHKLIRTPLGQWLQATRNDAVRVSCLGIYPQRVYYMAFLVSGFFAGIGGALLAIEFEGAQAGMFSVLHSGSYLMFTYLGGLGSVAGSAVGAVLQVLSVTWLPTLTLVWELYVGLVFIYAVLKWPQGLVGALLAWRVKWHQQPIPKQRSGMIMDVMARLCAFAGLVCAVELFYRVWDPYLQATWAQALSLHIRWLVACVVLLLMAVVLKRWGRTHA